MGETHIAPPFLLPSPPIQQKGLGGYWGANKEEGGVSCCCRDRTFGCGVTPPTWDTPLSHPGPPVPPFFGATMQENYENVISLGKGHGGTLGCPSFGGGGCHFGGPQHHCHPMCRLGTPLPRHTAMMWGGHEHPMDSGWVFRGPGTPCCLSFPCRGELQLVGSTFCPNMERFTPK